MDYDKDWKIVESSFWCRHKLGATCIYHANPNHLCVSEKCPLNYHHYLANKMERLRNKFKKKHAADIRAFNPEKVQEAWDKVPKKHNKKRKNK